MGTISIRKFIRWLPDEASEPTSTIVVTSPRLKRFVDLRILLPDNDPSWTGQDGTHLLHCLPLTTDTHQNPFLYLV